MRLDCWDADKSPAHAEAYREQCRADANYRLMRNNEYYNSEEYRIEQEKEMQRNRELGEAIGKLIAFIIIIHFKLMLFYSYKIDCFLNIFTKNKYWESCFRIFKKLFDNDITWTKGFIFITFFAFTKYIFRKI